jgi:hypothetical protein
MIEMLRVSVSILIASAMLAQNTPGTAREAPRHVDTALRERVNRFFQFEVEGKFRQAEAFVAEKDKDFYVAANKPKYSGFSIRSITYSDHFTKATVIVEVNRLMPVPGFEGHPIPAPVPSRWKLEKGKWCWYVDPADLRASPMGLQPLPGGGMPAMSGGAPAGTSSLPPIPNMAAAVRVDKSEVELKAGKASSEQVTILNPMLSPVTLSVADPQVPGLTVKLEHPELKTGESAVLRLESIEGGSTPLEPVTVKVRVQQTNQIIPIKVSFVR